MAKDKHDTKTSDLLVSKNALAQRAFKAKMKEEGFVQKQMWIHKQSYAAGFEAALLGSTNLSDFILDSASKVVCIKSASIGYIDATLKSATS